MSCIKSALLLAALAGVTVSGQDPAARGRLGEVRTVYLLKMAKGLDQYLAHEVRRSGALVVVTDPARADVVLTDRLGKALEDELDKLLAKPGESATTEGGTKAKEEDSALAGAPRTNPESTWGRGRGTVFLVDLNTRTVLWSDYRPSASSQSGDMKRAASRIAGHLRKDLEKIRQPFAGGSAGK